MEKRIGVVSHYYDHIGVAVLVLEEGLATGDTVHICGNHTDFVQRVESMEIDHIHVDAAGPDANVAFKVDEPVHKGDAIYLVPEHTGVVVGFVTA
ncbi:MAG: hypothetical protein R2873_06200 [Caldilineaceae bacterium]|nr:hypothetical protein [Caldilineaceae bacterium]